MYWLEVIRDSNLIRGSEIERLIKEANELTAIFAATDKTAKNKRTNQTSNIIHHTSNIKHQTSLCTYKKETEY